MANSRIARFVMEVAPPQFVSVMRCRTSKMLDTISEEERDAGLSDHRSSSTKGSRPSSFHSPSSSISSSSSASTSSAVDLTTFKAASKANSNRFLGDVNRSLSMFAE